jgi:hypothetical protein
MREPIAHRFAIITFFGESVEQVRADLPAHPESPSRLKVCRFTDRYILCGRYGAALS